MHKFNKPLRDLIAGHMSNLERQLALEQKYPDDVDNADESKKINAEFDRLEQDTVHGLYAMADMLVQVLHADRYTMLVERQMAESDKRADAYAWHEAQAKMAERVAIDEVV